MSETGAVSLDLIGGMLSEIQAEQRVIRAELRELRSAVLDLAEQWRRVERRLDDVERCLRRNAQLGVGAFAFLAREPDLSGDSHPGGRWH